MSMIKRWLEEVSVEQGFGGEITDEVIRIAEDRMAFLADRQKDERKEKILLDKVN